MKYVVREPRIWFISHREIISSLQQFLYCCCFCLFLFLFPIIKRKWPQYTESVWWPMVKWRLNLYQPSMIFRSRVTNYNMTVWILAGNYTSFTIAAGLIRLHMPGVKKSRVQLGRARVTIISMVITSTVYWKFQQPLVSQATLQPSIMFANSL